LFVFDGLHLSAEGYALWTSVVKPRLLADFPQAQR
jgi:lysophospholipase L1-like esterase